MSTMEMFEWFTLEDTYYEDSVNATQTAGLYFDALHVEQTNDGWNAILYTWLGGGDDEDFEAGFVMVDEAVHTTEKEAQEWAVKQDTARWEKEQLDDDD